jgi:hypothetical protein
MRTRSKFIVVFSNIQNDVGLSRETEDLIFVICRIFLDVIIYLMKYNLAVYWGGSGALHLNL